MASRLLDVVTEAEFQHSIETLCEQLGLLHYHVARSDKALVSAKGFPDLVIVGKRVIFAELKTEKGKLRPDQKDWLGGLHHAKAEVYIWRPSDMPFIVNTLHSLRIGT